MKYPLSKLAPDGELIVSGTMRGLGADPNVIFVITKACVTTFIINILWFGGIFWRLSKLVFQNYSARGHFSFTDQKWHHCTALVAFAG